MDAATLLIQLLLLFYSACLASTDNHPLLFEDITCHFFLRRTPLKSRCKYFLRLADGFSASRLFLAAASVSVFAAEGTVWLKAFNLPKSDDAVVFASIAFFAFRAPLYRSPRVRWEICLKFDFYWSLGRELADRPKSVWWSTAGFTHQALPHRQKRDHCPVMKTFHGPAESRRPDGRRSQRQRR